MTPNDKIDKIEKLIDQIKELADPLYSGIDTKLCVDFNMCISDSFHDFKRHAWDERTEEETKADERESYNEDFKYEK
jgi:hypothetical protein